MKNILLKINNRKYRAKEKAMSFFFGSVFVFSVLFIFIFSIFIYQTEAAINKQINYQGKLTTSLGVAVSNGTYNMEFKLYTVSTGGSAIWTETRTTTNRVTLSNGLFSVMLGEVQSLAGVDFNQTLYLGVNIGGTDVTPVWDGEMSPRKKLGSVPASVVSETVTGAAQVAITSLGTLTSLNMGGNITLGANTFTTTNTGLVSNLNADLLDGQHASAFQTALTNPITGTGTINYLPKFTGTSALGNSLIFDNGTNVGIGTTSPVKKLQVHGDIALSNGGKIGQGNGWGTDGNSYSATLELYNGATGYTTLQAATAYGLLLNPSGGNVGIGTTSPVEKLDVFGNIRMGNVSGSNIGIYAYNATPTLLYSLTRQDSITGGNGDLAIGAYRGIGLKSGITTVPSSFDFYLTSSGNIGLGTTNPAGKFDVQDGTGTQTAGDLLVDSASHIVYVGQLDAITDNTSLIVRDRLGNAKLTVPGAQGSHISMATVGEGKVGIGTTNPGAKLEVNDSSTAVFNALRLKNSGTGNSVGKGVSLSFHGIDTVGTNKEIGSISIISEDGGNYVGGAMIFSNMKAGSPWTSIERMRINGSGNVGIGTTGPTALLSLGNTSYTFAASGLSFGDGDTGFYESADDVIKININGSPRYNFDTSYFYGAGSNGFGISNANVSSTVPVFLPNYGDTNTGIGWVSSDILSLIAGGVNVLNANSSGNVGIGTTGPGASLHVKADASGNVLRLEENSGGEYYQLGVNEFGGLDIKNEGTQIAEFTDSNALQLYSGGVKIKLDPAGSSYFNTGNVGIGTTAPATKLHVFGTGVGNGLSFGDGTYQIYPDSGNNELIFRLGASERGKFSNGRWLGEAYGASNLPSFGGINDGDTGLAIWNSNIMSLMTGGSHRLTLIADGNVGIGTTTPQAKLSVSDAGGTGLEFTPDDANNRANLVVYDRATPAYKQFRILADSISFKTDAGATEGFYQGTNGNVGIGTTTPAAKLDVSSAGGGQAVFRTTYDANNYIAYAHDSINAVGGTFLSLQRGGATALAIDGSGGTHFIGAGLASYTTVGGVYIAGYSGASYGTVQAYSDVSGTPKNLSLNPNGGNVGIGTTGPSQKLDVNGNITTGSGNYIYSTYIAANTYQNNTLSNVVLKNNADGYDWIIQADNISGVAKIGFTLDPDVALKLGDLNLALNGKYISNDGDDEGIRIDNSGNVGIGTTAPARLLHVNSAANNYIRLQATGADTYAGYELTNDAQGWTTGVNNNDDYIINDGLQFGGDNIVTIQNGTPVNTLYIKDTGNIGIGNAAPLSKLGITGNASIGATYGAIVAPTSGLIIEGNVGIGTTAPAQKLQINYGHIRSDAVPAPSAPSGALAGLGAGNLANDTYYYAVTYVTSTGETSNGPLSAGVTVVNNAVNGQINVTIPVGSISGVTYTARKIYRSTLSGYWMYYIATVNDNSTTVYTDNITTGTGAALSAVAGAVSDTTAGIIYKGTSRAMYVGNDTSLGIGALNLSSSNTFGNTAVGNGALSSMTLGRYNTAIGGGGYGCYCFKLGWFNSSWLWCITICDWCKKYWNRNRSRRCSCRFNHICFNWI